MGCGSSKAVAVVSQNRNPVAKQPEDQELLVVKSSADSSREQPDVIETTPLHKVVKNQEKNSHDKFEERPALEARKSGFMSLIPLNAGPNYQGTPFDSGKSSKVDFQSGFDLDKASDQSSLFSDTDSGYLDSQYKNVITEKSEINAVRKVEQEFEEKNDLQLEIGGKSCPPLLSDKEKEDKKVQDLLKKTGLVQRPVTAKKSSAKFELVDVNASQDQESKRFRLPRIPREKPKPLTSDEIEQKLLKAFERKQEMTKIKVRNIQNSSISLVRRSSNAGQADNGGDSGGLSKEMLDRQNKLRELRDHLKAKKNAAEGAGTPRTDELISELENFRPKTASAFKPEFK